MYKKGQKVYLTVYDESNQKVDFKEAIIKDIVFYNGVFGVNKYIVSIDHFDGDSLHEVFEDEICDTVQELDEYWNNN
jgi:hypothetical protein